MVGSYKQLLVYNVMVCLFLLFLFQKNLYNQFLFLTTLCHMLHTFTYTPQASYHKILHVNARDFCDKFLAAQECMMFANTEENCTSVVHHITLLMLLVIGDNFSNNVTRV